MLAPFMPDKTAEVWRALGNAAPDVTPVTGPLPSSAGQRVRKITPLFPKPPAVA
jgi:methionyl-tRNA synthetase